MLNIIELHQPQSFSELTDLIEREAEQQDVHSMQVWKEFWMMTVGTKLEVPIIENCRVFWDFYSHTHQTAADIAFRNSFTPLHFAAKQGYDIYLKKLCNHSSSFNLNTLTTEHATPLLLAAQFNRPECFQALLQAGADINICDDVNTTCLHFAAMNGNVNLIQQLLANKNFTLKKQLASYVGSALQAAIINNQRDAVEPLIELMPITDLYNNTVLHTAIMSRTPLMLETLLPFAKHLLNNMNANRETALHIAVKIRHLDLVLILLAAGARCDITANDGNDATSLAIKHYFANQTLENKMLMEKVIEHAHQQAVDFEPYAWHLDQISGELPGFGKTFLNKLIEGLSINKN